MGASVERVLQKLGIEARRQGSRWWAERCPMPDHTDQNEAHRWKNFFIRADGTGKDGLWCCFSCKAGGRLIDLVMAVARLDVQAAREWLSDVDEAPAPEPVVRVRYEPLGVSGRRFRLPEGVEFAPLSKWNSVARDYATSRGLTEDQVVRWGIGCALMGRLVGRIVFPIEDQQGIVQNYAARTFVGDETVYLAAHERENPDLSTMLGERFWPKDRRANVVFVFEGALSGMALDRASRIGELAPAGIGISFAGLQGSDVANPRRALRLSSFGLVVSACDPDAAGERASQDIEAQLRGVPFRRMRYPSSKDAADTPAEELAEAMRAACSPP